MVGEKPVSTGHRQAASKLSGSAGVGDEPVLLVRIGNEASITSTGVFAMLARETADPVDSVLVGPGAQPATGVSTST